MFTGIIQKCGTLKERKILRGIMRIAIEAGSEFNETKIGDSVSVNGVCLSITDNRGGVLYFDVMKETRSDTTLGKLAIGSGANLERAIPASGRFDGHLVTGHIDGTGKVLDKIEAEGAAELRIKAKDEHAIYIVNKGSVAVDGVSLTVGDVKGSVFSVYLIPLTLKSTNLSTLKKGDEVNIETDIIAKYAEKFINARPGGAGSVNEQFLKRYGYV